MPFFRLTLSLLLFIVSFILGSVGEAGQATNAGFPDAPGKDLLMSKCFQCHSEGMWKDLRQDRRKWEGVLYRMVGRGALWTEDEINTMATYLSTAFGPQNAKAEK